MVAAPTVQARSGGPVCGPAAAQTLAQEGATRVYTVGGPTGRTYACLAGHARIVRLNAPRVNDSVTNVALSGPIVAYIDHTFAVDTGSEDIDVVDVATGRTLLTVPHAGEYVDGCALSFADIVDLVVTTRGSVAWTERVGKPTAHGGADCKATTFTVSRAETSSPATVLDTSRTIDPGSLRLSGHTVSWEDAGKRRSVALP
jgi:hypothetical protein